MNDSKPAFAYNYLGQLHIFESEIPLPTGETTLQCQVNYDGDGTGKGATIRLMMNDQLVAEGKLAATIASRFAVDEGSDVGMDRGSPVLKQVVGNKRYSAFNGQIKQVTLEVAPQKSE